MAKKVKVALIYDFDGTLSTTDMQNYGLIPTFGMSCKTFWNKANTFGDQNMMEQITSSMYYVFKTAKDKKIPLTRELFFECGKNIQFFEGVENWFERINHYGDMLDLEIEHYVISAGYEEIIEGCAIRKYFKEVYGCAYAYDDKGEAVWPARVVNYSTKTQYLSKINKGLGKLDDRGVNEFMPDEERPLPFTRMVKLLSDGRVNFALPADYREDEQIDTVVKTILVKLATERDLNILQEKEEKKKLEG